MILFAEGNVFEQMASQLINYGALGIFSLAAGALLYRIVSNNEKSRERFIDAQIRHMEAIERDSRENKEILSQLAKSSKNTEESATRIDKSNQMITQTMATMGCRWRPEPGKTS